MTSKKARIRWTGSHLAAREVGCLVDIAKVTGSAVDARTAAAEVLQQLARVIPYAAASVTAWNPITDRHETIANAGYPTEVVEHLATWFVEHDDVVRLMRDVDPTPLRWQDMPFDYRKLRSAREYFMPAGFDEGVTTCLYAADGRYTGCLHVSTDTRKHPNMPAMDVLAVLQTAIAGIPDTLCETSRLARSLGENDSATVLANDGRVVALPGRTLDPDLLPGTSLIAAATAHQRAHSIGARCLWEDTDGEWHGIRLERLAQGTLVLKSPTSLPHDLTPREIDVLTLLAEGRTTAEIASALVIAVKTAGKHVEHLMEKLAAESRTAAASRALTEGLVRLTSPDRSRDARTGMVRTAH